MPAAVGCHRPPARAGLLHCVALRGPWSDLVAWPLLSPCRRCDLPAFCSPVEPNRGYTGAELAVLTGVADVGACCSACFDRADCNAFAFDGRAGATFGECRLKRNAGNTNREVVGMASGRVVRALSPPPPSPSPPPPNPLPSLPPPPRENPCACRLWEATGSVPVQLLSMSALCCHVLQQARHRRALPLHRPTRPACRRRRRILPPTRRRRRRPTCRRPHGRRRRPLWGSASPPRCKWRRRRRHC